MTRFHALLAAFFATVLLVSTAQAALHPLELSALPADAPNFSAADNQLQLSLALGLRSIVPAKAPAVTVAPKLNLTPTGPAAGNPDLLVGRYALASFHNDSLNWQARPSFQMRDEWDFLRRQTLGPDNLERFADMFDVDEKERPWSTTTTVHLMAPTKDWIVPFATIAHEVDVNEDFDRFGLGAGAMLNLGKNANFGAEIIHFGGDHSTANDAFSKETQFLTRLQIEF